MAIFPNSLREINNLHEDEKREIYGQLIPDWVYENYDIDRDDFIHDGHSLIHFVYPEGSRILEISIRRSASDRDPLMYLNMADTFNNQLLVLLVVMNDPDAPRFNTDIDTHGNRTNFGTTSRNIPAEIDAMRAGLAPGQIRKGIRAFKYSTPFFERFVQNMGHELFLIEPLAYHNAIVFEKYGFSYIRGLNDMQMIHESFLEGGGYHQKLSGKNQFRQSDAWKTIRKRSWAIHDGILGHPFTGFQMYKRINHHANVSTAPNIPF